MSGEQKTNGQLLCKFLDHEWNQYKDSMQTAKEMITEIHGSTESWERIATAIEEIRDKWIDAALGKGMIPQETVKEMISEQRKAYTSIIKTITLCLGVIILVLIGLKALAPHWFAG